MSARAILASLCRAGFLSGALLAAGVTTAAPVIEITNVPPYGSSENLSGRVLDATPAAHRVAVFIYVPSAGWWSKPYCDPALTVIQPDGRWTTDITTGGADAFATKITALVVSTNYREPCVTGPPSLPASVLAQALASATVERADPAIRLLNFSGYDWWVKESPGVVGPGPNYFSASTNNVWLDAEGRLHLRITNRSNQWHCAEIVSQRTFGYGSYRFELDFPVDNLNPNAVLGLFTWSDHAAYAHREIDIECSRWGNSNDVNNAQFVVQPWDASGHLVRYAVPAGLTHSTHLFVWEPNRIRFQSLKGGFSPTLTATNLIRNWTFTDASAVPQTGDENVRINLWLNNGDPPAGNAEVEVVLRNFEFVPLGSPPPAVLGDPALLPGGGFQFTLLGQPDRRYEIQASADLLDWQPQIVVLATNSRNEVIFPEAATAGWHFLRALTKP